MPRNWKRVVDVMPILCRTQDVCTLSQRLGSERIVLREIGRDGG